MSTAAMRKWRSRLLVVAAGLLLFSSNVSAHSGPPYPVVSNRTAGPYRLSVWTDPDATDDGTAGGQFWVTIEAARPDALPPDTRAQVAIRPGGGGLWREALAAPVDGNPSRQFAALVMPHEGPFDVRVVVSGTLGQADVTTTVQATYDLRPAPMLLAVYLLPFLLVGFLWTKRLWRRRSTKAH
jgi:hypothetical protein